MFQSGKWVHHRLIAIKVVELRLRTTTVDVSAGGLAWDLLHRVD